MSKNTKTKKTASKTPKAIAHNKNYPIVKASRTKIIKLLNDTKGKFFTSTHIDKDGNPRTMNAIRYKDQGSQELGYIRVYSVADKGIRMINPQTITDLSFQGIHYKKK